MRDVQEKRAFVFLDQSENPGDAFSLFLKEFLSLWDKSQIY